MGLAVHAGLARASDLLWRMLNEYSWLGLLHGWPPTAAAPMLGLECPTSILSRGQRCNRRLPLGQAALQVPGAAAPAGPSSGSPLALSRRAAGTSHGSELHPHSSAGTATSGGGTGVATDEAVSHHKSRSSKEVHGRWAEGKL